MNDKKSQQAARIQNYARLIEQASGKAIRPYRADGYVNLMNRYGTSKDTTEHYNFVPEPDVPDDSLTMLYEGNGLFSKIIDAPAEEAIKHGFKLDDISDQEVETFYQEALDELDWEEVAMTGIKWARLFGGAIAVMLINDGGGLEDPLNWKRIKSIDDIRVYDRSVIQPDYSTMFSYDPRNPFSTRGSRLGMPEFYHVNSRFGSFTVHESRCLIFQNGVLPENSSNTIYQLWGMPEYVRIHRAMRDAELAHSSGPKMLDRSVQPVYKMKDLAALLATEEGESQVLKRLQVIDLARGLLNSLVIDNEGEDYDFKTFQYTGVADVIDGTCNFLSAITNIPQTILFGRSPAGMNATGDSDLENWYSYCGRIQKRMVKSNLRYLLSIIFQAGVYTGEVDEVPKIKVAFNPLKVLSDSEQAELDNKKASTALIKAQTVQIYRDMEVIDSIEIRKKLADSGEFEIDTILDEYEDEEDLLAAYTGQEVAPGFTGSFAESGDFDQYTSGEKGGPGEILTKDKLHQYGTGVDVDKHETDPGTKGSAPANAPAATKLPQDMSKEEQEEAKDGETAQEYASRRWKEINTDEAPYGVGVLIVKDGRILCGTRHNDTGYGLICGPGGHGENGETYEQSAFRETEEEFGISPKELIPIGVGPFEPESGLRSHIFLCTDFDGEPDCVDLEMTNPKFRTLEELEALKPSLFPPFADSLEILKDCLFNDNEDGGPGSGNHGHKGVPGQVGGSAPGDGTSYRGATGEKCREYGETLSSKTKAQIAKQAAKDPEFKKLTDAISLYTQGGYAQQRRIAEKLVDGSFQDEDDFTVGKFVQDNRFMVVKDLYKGQGLEESTSSTADGMAQLIGTINESKPYEGKLYRAAQDRNIIKVGGDYTPFVIPEVGQTVQLSAPTSFTTDKAVADKLMMQKMGDRIFYTIDEGASAVDVSKLSPYKQKEMLTCGTYEVVAVKKTETKNFIVGGEQYATKAQKERGLVDNWGAPHYITYDVEIQLRQVGKVSIGTKSDAEDEHIILSGEQFEDRMVLEDNTVNATSEDGGPGSGNFGHEGRPGKIGGSSSSGHVEAASVKSHLEDYQVKYLSSPGTAVTGGWGMKSTCKQYMRKEGASEETLDAIDRLFDGHKSGGDWQKDCDEKIAKHINDGDAIGQALIARSQFETGCYEEWKAAHPDSNQLNQHGELRVYRKGDRSNGVECWTIDPDGADMGHGGIGVDHETTLEQLQREGYSVIAGFGTMGGTPGEGEITFVKTGKGESDEKTESTPAKKKSIKDTDFSEIEGKLLNGSDDDSVALSPFKQLTAEEFEKVKKANIKGVDPVEKTVPLDELYSTQPTNKMSRLQRVYEHFQEDPESLYENIARPAGFMETPNKTIRVYKINGKDVIADGNHRLAIMSALGDTEAKVEYYDLDNPD